MATTTNYGWTTPNDTDLVKDGAAAIRTLGSSIDTTTKALNPSTTLGDVEYRSATANTNTRLAIGSTGNVLTVAGGVPTWAAPAPATSMTLLTSGSLSGASVTTATLSTSYQDLVVVIRNARPANNDANLRLRFNGDTNNRYAFQLSGFQTGLSFTESSMRISSGADNTTSNSLTTFTVSDYANTTTWKTIFTPISITNQSGVPAQFDIMTGLSAAYNQTPAITSMTFFYSSGNFAAGNYFVYGVQ
jgi:hypothetical protein